MNLLFLLGKFPSIGGVETVTAILANEFSARGHEVHVIQPHHPELGDVTDYPFVLLGKTGQPPSFLLMGDSHAMASSPGFDDAARLLNRSGLFYRARLCPLSGISESGDADSLTLLRMMYPHWEHNMDPYRSED